MIVKVLKHKQMTNTFGHIAHLAKNVVHVWPTNIPELFPESASIETIKELNKGNKGDWKEQIENYEMVEAKFEVIQS